MMILKIAENLTFFQIITFSIHILYNVILKQKIIFEMAYETKFSDKLKKTEFTRRRWDWIWHILRKDPEEDTVVALG